MSFSAVGGSRLLSLADKGFLLLADMPGDARRRYGLNAVTVQAKPPNTGNGMACDAGPNQLFCEHPPSNDARIRSGADADREVLTGHFEGKTLNSPDDVIVGGSLHFTDPTCRRMSGALDGVKCDAS